MTITQEFSVRVASPVATLPSAGHPAADGVPATLLVDALWAWAAGTTASSRVASPRLTLRGGRGVLTGRLDGRALSADVRVAGESLADSDVVVPAAGASIELRPYHRRAHLTVLQPTLLTLATAEDWAALAHDAALALPWDHCLVGLAAMHLFDATYTAPDCARHHGLYREHPVDAGIRRHVRSIERARRRAIAVVATSTNQEWVGP